MTPLFSTVVAIDPGKDKCGVAIVNSADFDTHRVLDAVVKQEIVPRDNVMSEMRQLMLRFPSSQIVIGHATTSGSLREELQREWPQHHIVIIDETGSTLEARDLYWKAHPPRGWRRVLPLSLQVPPQPIDDFAAIVLAARFLTASIRHNEYSL